MCSDSSVRPEVPEEADDDVVSEVMDMPGSVSAVQGVGGR
jgi:hypothetical protein